MLRIPTLPNANNYRAATTTPSSLSDLDLRANTGPDFLKDGKVKSITEMVQEVYPVDHIDPQIAKLLKDAMDGKLPEPTPARAEDLSSGRFLDTYHSLCESLYKSLSDAANAISKLAGLDAEVTEEDAAGDSADSEEELEAEDIKEISGICMMPNITQDGGLFTFESNFTGCCTIDTEELTSNIAIRCIASDGSAHDLSGNALPTANEGEYAIGDFTIRSINGTNDGDIYFKGTRFLSVKGLMNPGFGSETPPSSERLSVDIAKVPTSGNYPPQSVTFFEGHKLAGNVVPSTQDPNAFLAMTTDGTGVFFLSKFTSTGVQISATTLELKHGTEGTFTLMPLGSDGTNIIIGRVKVPGIIFPMVQRFNERDNPMTLNSTQLLGPMGDFSILPNIGPILLQSPDGSYCLYTLGHQNPVIGPLSSEYYQIEATGLCAASDNSFSAADDDNLIGTCAGTSVPSKPYSVVPTPPSNFTTLDGTIVNVVAGNLTVAAPVVRNGLYPTHTATPTPKTPSDHSNSTPKVIGGVLASIIGAIITIGGGYYYCKKNEDGSATLSLVDKRGNVRAQNVGAPDMGALENFFSGSKPTDPLLRSTDVAASGNTAYSDLEGGDDSYVPPTAPASQPTVPPATAPHLRGGGATVIRVPSLGVVQPK